MLQRYLTLSRLVLSLDENANLSINTKTEKENLPAEAIHFANNRLNSTQILAASAIIFSTLLLAGAMFPVAGTPPGVNTTSGGGAESPFARQAQLDTNTTDTDGDGLPDSLEQSVYNTDPTDTDTDNDGYPDGMEVSCEQVIPDADPLRTDIYVEVDSTQPTGLSDPVQASIIDTFENAPVSNPDGSTGIDIHLITDDTGLSANSTVYSNPQSGPENDISDFRTNYSNYRSNGYYYVLLTDNVAYNGDDYFVGAGRPGVAMLEPYNSTIVTASLFMHELGHAMGLDTHQRGIDEERYSTAEYDSVMNYNGLYKQLGYSDGNDSVSRDEWQFIVENRAQPDIQCASDTCVDQCMQR